MNEVTMTTTYLPDDPGSTNWGAPGVKFDAWRCVLTYDGRSMAVTYRMGEGLRVCAPMAGKGRDKYAGPGAVDLGPWFGKVPEHAKRYSEPRVFAVPPTVGDVLSSLMLDASIREDCADVWDLLDLLGMDADRRAEKTWRAIVEQTDELRALFMGTPLSGLIESADEIEGAQRVGIDAGRLVTIDA